jgi:hypothetical protein
MCTCAHVHMGNLQLDQVADSNLSSCRYHLIKLHVHLTKFGTNIIHDHLINGFIVFVLVACCMLHVACLAFQVSTSCPGSLAARGTWHVKRFGAYVMAYSAALGSVEDRAPTTPASHEWHCFPRGCPSDRVPPIRLDSAKYLSAGC